MQVKNIAECSKGSILQYFRPSLSYYLSIMIFVYIWVAVLHKFYCIHNFMLKNFIYLDLYATTYHIHPNKYTLLVA